jgi:XTP/dITP diphosphohydrolase
MKIVLASSNKHKVQEINDIIKNQFNLNVEFILPPEGFNPIEDGKTFEENSYIKAIEAWKISKTWVLADDSGLCINALGGKPGIFSARYAETPALRIERVLKEMDGISKDKRDAHFTCAMTLINPKGEVEFKYQGICEGSIIEETRGKNGFGYDPIFLVKGDTRTMAELTEDEKNLVSHRSVALRKVLNYLSDRIND